MPNRSSARNVLYLMNLWLTGGSETQIYTLLKYLDRTRYQPYVCSLYSDSQIEPTMSSIDVTGFSLGIRRVLEPKTLLRLLRLVHYCRLHRIRVIQAVRTDIIAVIVARLAGVPIVLGAQRNVRSRERRNRYRWVRTLSERALSGVIANSQAAVDYRLTFSPLSPDRVFCVPNGLDLQKFDDDRQVDLAAVAPGIPAEAPRLIIVSRLEIDAKGHRTLIEALKRPELEDCHLLIVGDGPDRSRLEAMISDLHLGKRVHMLGHRNDVTAMMKLADIVVVPSNTESSPNVVLEAWAARRPVIASKVGGIPELIQSGINGELVPPGDPSALSVALKSLLADPSRRRSMSESGRALVEQRYSAAVMASNTADVYDQLLRAR